MIQPTREEKLDALEELLKTVKRMPYRNGRLNPTQAYLLLLYKREVANINNEDKPTVKKGRKPKAAV
jgi:hypothetical protein